MSQLPDDSRSKGKKVELIIQQLNHLPTLPAVAARLLQLTIKSDTQAQEVVQLIESDPSLASRIIQMATRAHTGINKQSASISKIVVLLGFDAIRNAVLSIKVFDALGGVESQEGDVFDRPGFWKHSLAVACAASMLSKHIDRKLDPEEAFICGLLHDLGKVALSASLPKSFSRVVQLTEASVGNIAEMEQKVLGIDHTVVGKRLAQKWHLPDVIVETIWLHQQWPQALPEMVKHRRMVQTVYLADLMAREQRIGYSGNHVLVDSGEHIAEQLGCSAAAYRDVVQSLREQISERAVLLGLDDIQPMQMFHEAVAEANSELGRLNARLQKQNARLQQRSRYFDMLTDLGDALDAGQSVTDVCSLVTDVWHKHLHCEHCAVYARNPQSKIFEGAVKLAGAETPTIFIVDGTDDQESYGEEDFPQGFAVNPLANSHGWFLEQVSSEFSATGTCVVPLQSADELVGGIIWQPTADVVDYPPQLQEIKAVAASAALAIKQALWQERQNRLCEQLAQANQLLQEAQHELAQKRTLAAVGEMACGAAHEINNPLAVIVGRSQLLADAEANPERKRILELIAKQGQTITSIITDLLEFARPALPHVEPVKPHELLAAAIQAQADHAQRSQVHVDMVVDPALPDVMVDPGQGAAALAELIANAIDSYQSQGGQVRVTAQPDELGSELVVDIVDQGCGMDSELLQKAFAPFFSAKQAGRGRGLGLSRSKTYIENNGGSLKLRSEPGKGSTARVTFPMCVRTTAHAVAK